MRSQSLAAVTLVGTLIFMDAPSTVLAQDSGGRDRQAGLVNYSRTFTGVRDSLVWTRSPSLNDKEVIELWDRLTHSI
jgi:hypothetical protein